MEQKMLSHQKDILSLIEFVKIDRFYVSCHFKCSVKGKVVVVKMGEPKDKAGNNTSAPLVNITNNQGAQIPENSATALNP